MKVFLIFLGIFALSQGLTQEEIELQAEGKRVIEKLIANGVTPKDMASNLKQMFENFLNKCEDPCFIESKDINVNLFNETVILKGLLSNLLMKGVHDHLIDPLTFTVLPKIKFDMAMSFNSVEIDSAYVMDGNIAGMIPAWGDGDLVMNVTDVVAKVSVELTSRELSLVVKSLDFDLQLGSLYTYLGNFCGGLGDVLAPVLNDNVADYIRRILYYYKDDIKNAIITAVNEFLHGKSLSDLIDIINGLGTTSTAATATSPNSDIRKVYTYL